VAFRVLGAGNFPDHRTVNRFRQEHLEEFAGIFGQVVKLAREMKLLRMGTLAIDGTKVRANASKHKAMSYGRMRAEEQKLRTEIAELLRRAQEVDEAEDEQYGAERRGDELPEELQRRADRLKKIQEAKQRLEERQKEEDRAAGRNENDGGWASGVRSQGGRSRHRREFGEVPEKKQENFTDPESRIMKTQDGFQQCYNGQIAVEAESRLIVANDVVQNAADNDCLVPMTEAAQRNTEEKPERVLADAGYRSEGSFRKLAEKKITAYVALGREGQEGNKLLPSAENPHTQAMEQRLKSEEGQHWSRKRKWLAEPPFGWIKHVLGFRRFSLRGLKKVRGEWQLLCAALNLKRISAMNTA
jgi:Transposase DDE domain